MPLRQGRYIEERDYDRNVVVVSDRVVALLWPGENPLGKHLRMLTLVRNPGGFEPKRLPGGGIDFRPMEVVGVVADTREGALNREPPAVVYAPYRFQAVGWGACVLRTQGDPVVFKNSISLKLLVEGWGHFRVIRSVDARDIRPVFVCCDLDRRLDEPASAACHRLSHRGESCSSRTHW